MFGGKAVTLYAMMASRFGYAKGITGILASLCLIAMYASLGLQDGSLEDGTSLGSAFHFTGSANDLLVSLSTVLMIPVALFLGRYLGSAVG